MAVTMPKWLADSDWWVVKGSTGSGKTFFVEHLKNIISADGKPVIYVPQYPMFKPQLSVQRFLNLLPLTKEARSELFTNLEEMKVPTDCRIGGKLMGMIDLPGLSGGQRKKLLVAVCVAIAHSWQCPFVVLDEPFAGIDEKSMDAVLSVMRRGQTKVPGLKYIVVTHDHFDLLPDSAQLLEVKDRQVSTKGDYECANGEAAEQLASGLIANMTAAPKRRPLVDMYLVKRHFMELEFGVPLVAYMIFGLLLGCTTANYKGHLPDLGMDVVFVYMKMFLLEYPHFGGIINYSFKRSQHLEDYYLNVTARKFGILETLLIATIQQFALTALVTGILCMSNSFWWISPSVFFIDAWYAIVTAAAYFLLPILVPNPIIAMASIFPYVCVWGFLNGALVPRMDYAHALSWTCVLSPVYHVACAARIVTDKIEIVVQSAECTDELWLHLLFINPLAWAVAAGIAAKLILRMRKKSALRRKAVTQPEGLVSV